MSLDLSAAVNAAARALVQAESSGLCEYGKVCALCDCFADADRGRMRDGFARDHASAILSAAAPLIEAQVRAQIAADIETAASELVELDRGRGGLVSDDTWHNYDGFMVAARIARGGA